MTTIKEMLQGEMNKYISAYQLVNDDDPIVISGKDTTAEKCETIVEAVAVEFMIWSRNSVSAKSYLSAKELYELFKKEKGL